MEPTRKERRLGRPQDDMEKYNRNEIKEENKTGVKVLVKKSRSLEVLFSGSTPNKGLRERSQMKSVS